MTISLKRSADELFAYAQAFPEVLDPQVLAERMKGLLIEGGHPEVAVASTPSPRGED